LKEKSSVFKFTLIICFYTQICNPEIPKSNLKHHDIRNAIIILNSKLGQQLKKCIHYFSQREFERKNDKKIAPKIERNIMNCKL